MEDRRVSNKRFLISAGLALLSALLLSLSAGYYKFLTTIGPLQIAIFIRFLFPLILQFVFWVPFKRKEMHMHSIWPHVLRAVAVVIAQYSFLYVLSQTNILLSVLLYSTNGLFTPILLYLFFRVKASNKTIIAIIISFIGVAIAMGISESIVSPLALVGLLSGALTATSRIIQHRASKTDHSLSMNIVLFAFCTLITFPFLFFSPIAWHDTLSFFHQLSILLVAIILICSLFTILSQNFKTRAYKNLNKPSTLEPFLYATIPFAGVIDWLWHGIIPELHTITGVAIIITAGIFMSIRKKT